MYGSPTMGLYGHKPNPTGRKPGCPSTQAKFAEKQSDLFEKDRYLAQLEHQFPALAAYKRGNRNEQG